LLRLVTIDLSQADLDVFERYEASVLALLPKHRGRLELRVRALDGQTETHLLYFPDEQAFDAFRSDPARLMLADEWKRCGALSQFNSSSGLPKVDLCLWSIFRVG
jgi:hypothetical protein